MKDLIKMLEQPTHDADGISKGPTVLNRRAAEAIKRLTQVIDGLTRSNNSLVHQVHDLTKVVDEHNKSKKTTDSTSTSAGSTAPGDPTQQSLFE